jgi:hypothetical protein
LIISLCQKSPLLLLVRTVKSVSLAIALKRDLNPRIKLLLAVLPKIRLVAVFHKLEDLSLLNLRPLSSKRTMERSLSISRNLMRSVRRKFNKRPLTRRLQNALQAPVKWSKENARICSRI